MEERSITAYNHGEALLTYFHQLQQEQRFTDVVIQCQGDVVSLCHRLILAAFSSHFETALAGVEASSQITLDIDPKITGVGVDDLKRIVEFFYTGHVQVTATLYKSAVALGANTLAAILEAAPETAELLEDTEQGTNFLNACRRFFLEGRFCDVTIRCQGLFLMTCHRLVLCAYSDHFEAALSSTDNCPQVTLDIDSAITGVSGLDLRTIIDFMYTGVIRAPRRRLRSLGSAGRTLGVTKLSEILSMHDHKHHISHLSSAGATSTSYTTNDPSVNVGGIDDAGSSQLGSVQFVTLGADSENYNVPETVGATEDVAGASSIIMEVAEPVPEPDMGAETLMIDGIAQDEPSSIDDDTEEIYDEYVSGPRRRKNPLGTHRGQIKLKCREYKRRSPVNDDISSLFIEESQMGSRSRINDLNSFVSEPDSDVAAITLTMVAPLSKRRRNYSSDTFGYGLPEIVATADVTVPLLVGDQQLMMEKPFKCPFCEHRTKEKSALEKHVRCIHTLETPYKCRYCNQAFKVQSNLVRHIRAHTGEKPYICKKCGAAYADKKNMDAHVFREHLKMKPLECPSPGCMAKFWRQDRFNYHCRRMHSMEPPEGYQS